eukprot:m.174087 g.174087  ORF g.174087 m.174087 type:complete len:477 (+) comp39103_c0_seq1:37-1467(+)
MAGVKEGDFKRDRVHRGWESLEEEVEYWIPESDIIGRIPANLHGTFLRNGPGVDSIYGTKLKHPIDSDGMVCALSFIDGHVHFRSRFVSSKTRRDEAHVGKFLYPGQMGTNNTGMAAFLWNLAGSLLSGKLPFPQYRNPSNTSVFYWGGKILTTYETHLPHCLDPRTLNTLGLENLGGTLQLGTFSAHSRIDTTQQPNRLCCFSLRPHLNKPAQVDFYEFDEKWNCLASQKRSIDGLNYAHDFLLLPHYYVVHMTPFVKVSKSLALKWASGISSPGEDMKYYPDLPSRFVFIPRPNHPDPTSEIISVDTDPFHIFHFGTGYQEGSNVHFIAVCLGPRFDMTFDQKMWLSNVSAAPGRLFKFHVDLTATDKKCIGRQVDAASVEFPTVNPYRNGQKSGRYSYLMANDRAGENLPYRDVVKFDFEGNGRQVWRSSGVIGEPVFAPRLGSMSASRGEDDDGYVLVQLYNPAVHRTEFVC